MDSSALWLTLVYVVYALTSVGLTVWLARVLSANGHVFLERVFPADQEFAQAVNRLLVVGFYLVNLGYACIHLAGGHAHNAHTAIETLSTKLGWLLIVLATMHFGNLFIFHRIRRGRSAQPVRLAPPPIAPTAMSEGHAVA